jgi:aquaporin Z
MPCGWATTFSSGASNQAMRSGGTGANPLRPLGPAASLRAHWPEYLIEAAALGAFMVSAGVVTALLDAPASPAAGLVSSAGIRRALVGLAMGGTAMGIIYSPWGKRSGAHMNPAITTTFLLLGKIPLWDAAFYVLFQFLGGLAGVLLTAASLGRAFTAPPVHWVVTVPGPQGEGAALAGEATIAFIMMLMIVTVSNRRGAARFTGLLAGILISLFVTFESPYSGFGMNPARTFSSALPSGTWTALWIYFAAPTIAMLLAAQAFVAFRGQGAVRCCKLHHRSARACIFCGAKVTPKF